MVARCSRTLAPQLKHGEPSSLSPALIATSRHAWNALPPCVRKSRHHDCHHRLGFRVQGSGGFKVCVFSVLGFKNSSSRIWGLGFSVLGFGISGLGFRGLGALNCGALNSTHFCAISGSNGWRGAEKPSQTRRGCLHTIVTGLPRQERQTHSDPPGIGPPQGAFVVELAGEVVISKMCVFFCC